MALFDGKLDANEENNTTRRMGVLWLGGSTLGWKPGSNACWESTLALSSTPTPTPPHPAALTAEILV